MEIYICVFKSEDLFVSDSMVLGRSMFRGVVLLLAFAQLGRSLEISDFYDFEREIRLENGANKFEYVKLDTSINFFSDIYDHIYVSAWNVENPQNVQEKLNA